MKTNEFTMFRLSKPWGYHPPSVEARIKEYESALREINEKYQETKQIIISQQQSIEKLEEELRRMHLEMSSLELPEVESAIEHFVLDDFKNYNNNSCYNNNNTYKKDSTDKKDDDFDSVEFEIIT